MNQREYKIKNKLKIVGVLVGSLSPGSGKIMVLGKIQKG